MKYIAIYLMLVALAGCASEINPKPILQSQEDRSRAEWKQMENEDTRLRAQFEKIQVGISPQKVRTLMGIDPQIRRDDLWGFKLSHASDTGTESAWTLLVAFEHGTVKSKQASYTCLYRTERQ